MIKEMLRSNKK